MRKGLKYPNYVTFSKWTELIVYIHILLLTYTHTQLLWLTPWADRQQHGRWSEQFRLQHQRQHVRGLEEKSRPVWQKGGGAGEWRRVGGCGVESSGQVFLLRGPWGWGTFPSLSLQPAGGREAGGVQAVWLPSWGVGFWNRLENGDVLLWCLLVGQLSCMWGAFPGSQVTPFISWPLLLYWVSLCVLACSLLTEGMATEWLQGALCVFWGFLFVSLSSFRSPLPSGAPKQTGVFVPVTAFLAFRRRKRTGSLHFSNNLV